MIRYTSGFRNVPLRQIGGTLRPVGRWLLAPRPAGLGKGALPLCTPRPRRREARGAGVAGFALVLPPTRTGSAAAAASRVRPVWPESSPVPGCGPHQPAVAALRP